MICLKNFTKDFALELLQDLPMVFYKGILCRLALGFTVSSGWSGLQDTVMGDQGILKGGTYRGNLIADAQIYPNLDVRIYFINSTLLILQFFLHWRNLFGDAQIYPNQDLRIYFINSTLLIFQLFLTLINIGFQ